MSISSHLPLFMISGTVLRFYVQQLIQHKQNLYTLEILSLTSLETETYEGLIHSYQVAEVQSQIQL